MKKVTFKEVTKNTQTKARHPRLETSIFYFTVNSNESASSMEQSRIERWKEQQRKLWRDDIYYLLTTAPKCGDGIGEYKLIPENLIESINVEIAFEVGGEQDRLHLHGIVTVRHYSKVRLNYTAIHSILHELMDDKNQYFKAVVKHDDKENFLEYMRKYDANIEKYDINFTE